MLDTPPLSTPSDIDFRRELSALRRALHQIPELGFAEHETSALVQSWLTDRGFEIQGPLAGTGFYVDIAGTQPGPTVAYRADMDALPVQEATDAAYASCHPGRMHACGHDAHMTIACGVAVQARQRRDGMAGTLRVLFQPCEERTPSGAPLMIRDGVLDGVDAIYAIHVDPTLPVGRFGFRAGPITAACSPFLITVEGGQSGHSARPHEAVDTVWVATQIAAELYGLPGRVSDARQTAVLTVCRFQAGEALNVVPARVELGGTLRCIDRATLVGLRDAITRVAGGLGAVYGAQIDVAFDEVLPAVLNTEPEVVLAEATAQQMFGGDAIVHLPLPSMGGEDFAYYLERIPGAMIRVGTASGAETRYPLHHARFDLDEAALPLAARLMAEVCRRRMDVHA